MPRRKFREANGLVFCDEVQMCRSSGGGYGGGGMGGLGVEGAEEQRLQLKHRRGNEEGTFSVKTKTIGNT